MKTTQLYIAGGIAVFAIIIYYIWSSQQAANAAIQLQLAKENAAIATAQANAQKNNNNGGGSIISLLSMALGL